MVKAKLKSCEILNIEYCCPSLIESCFFFQATEMGRMIDVDTDIGRESRGPKLRDQVAKPLDINALLSARKDKLKGTKIADLEAEQERRRKQHLADMQEQDKNLDENGNLIKKPEGEKEQLKAKEIAQLGDEEGDRRRRRNRRYIKKNPVSRILRLVDLEG